MLKNISSSIIKSIAFNNTYNFATYSKANVPRRLQDRQPNREKIFTLEDKKIQYNPFQALSLMRLHSFATFTESVEVCVRLGVNPKNGQQIVRGSVFMPSGIGKQTKVAVLCTKGEYEELLAQGVKIDVFLNDAQIKKFDKLFSTSDQIVKIKHLGRALGPKGLMPNAKVGTLVKIDNMQKTLKEAKAGQITYRVDAGKNVHALLGKITFTDEQLLQNFKVFMLSLVEKKPAGLKGRYFTDAYLKSTIGPRWRLNLVDIDPRTPKCIWSLLQDEQPKEQSIKTQ